MDILRNLLVNHAFNGQVASNLLKFEFEEYRALIEVSLSVAVCLGMFTYGIRAFFNRKAVVSDKHKETQISPEDEIEEVPRGSPEDEDDEELVSEEQLLDENVVQQLTLLITDFQESDPEEDNEIEIEEDQDEMDVRRIVDAIEKIKELDPAVTQFVKELSGEDSEKDSIESDDIPNPKEVNEDVNEVRQIEIVDKEDPEEVVEVKRKPSLTMRKPYLVYKQSAPQAQLTTEKKPTIKRSTSQGGHNPTVAPRRTRINSGNKANERGSAGNDNRE